MKKQQSANTLLIIIIITFLVAVGGFLILRQDSSTELPASIKTGQKITVDGEIVCLPHRDKTGPPGRGMCAKPRITLADTAAEDRDKNYDIIVLVNEAEQDYAVGQSVEIKATVSSSKIAVYLTKVY